MATLTATSTASSSGFDITNIPYFIGDIASSWVLPTNIHISNFLHQQDYYGTFNFDKNGNASGNIISTYYQGFNSTYPDYSITDVSIDAKTAFSFIERREIDKLFSTIFFGDDFIRGTDKSDNLNGFNGNDILVGQAGNDILNGGEGLDIAHLSGISAQTTLTRTPTGWWALGPDGLDTLISIENVKFDNGTVIPRFDALKYIASYPDLITTFKTDEISAETHYLQIGFYEGRAAKFDALNYIASYADLVVTFGTDETAAQTHYILSGFHEGRTATFDALRYIASHPDLITAFGLNELAAEAHYIRSGFYEGRSVTFDTLQYLHSNPDVMAAFGLNEKAAQVHYIQHGFHEGRKIVSLGSNAQNYSVSDQSYKDDLEFSYSNEYDGHHAINIIGISSTAGL